MREVERIRDQIHRGYHGDAWHGPSLSELLKDVSAAQAAAHPLEQAHSIWEIVHHLASWAAIVNRRLVDPEKVEITPETDWPPVGKTDAAAWKAARARLEAAHAELEKTIGTIPDEALDRPAKGSPSTPYVLLHGVVQHDLYHGGQIAILKKALAGK